MKRVKGCLNSECKEYKKTYYKASDEYCVKCGTKLSFVCKHPKCFKRLPDEGKEKYCSFHIEERKDRKEQRGEKIKKVGGGIVAVGGFLVTAGKAAYDYAKKK